MGGYLMLPRFHFAFRRTLFYLMLLSGYLTLGALLFFFLWRKGSAIVPSSAASTERLDFERAELLNVLYAESIGRAEHDWALLANQKLDSYERSLIARVEAGHTQTIRQRKISLNYAFRYAFGLITTIGPVDIDLLSFEVKIFTLIFALIGIPLWLAYLGQCVKAASSAFAGTRRTPLVALGALFTLAICHDIIESGSDDTPFLNAILSVFLTLTTIGCEDEKDELPTALLVPAVLIALSLFVAAFASVQHALERAISPYELGFAQSYAKLERAISGTRLEILEEEDEIEDEIEDDAEDNDWK